jgi:hypothetical protein
MLEVKGQILADARELLSYAYIFPLLIVNGKVIPLHAMEAHGVRGGNSSYSFLTSALDGGVWSASRPGRALPPVPIGQEAGWAPEPVWTQGLEVFS